jgi:hypothetical protein
MPRYKVTGSSQEQIMVAFINAASEDEAEEIYLDHVDDWWMDMTNSYPPSIVRRVNDKVELVRLSVMSDCPSFLIDDIEDIDELESILGEGNLGSI